MDATHCEKKSGKTTEIDLIDRQEAIDALDDGAELLRRVLDNADIVGAEREKYEWGLELIELCISDMQELPSVQSDVPDKNVGDIISRQAAIDGLYEMSSDIDHLCTVGDYVSFLESLSAQPEVIRCKDCLMHGVCRFEQGLGLNGYCSQAERRIDE